MHSLKIKYRYRDNNSKHGNENSRVNVRRNDSSAKITKKLNTNLTMEDDLFPNFYWRAYKGSASALKLIKIPKEYIVVGAENKHVISIFSLLGKIHCLYNLEFPLPTLWNLSVSSFEKRKEQYEEAADMLKKIEIYNKEKDGKRGRQYFYIQII